MKPTIGKNPSIYYGIPRPRHTGYLYEETDWDAARRVERILSRRRGKK